MGSYILYFVLNLLDALSVAADSAPTSLNVSWTLDYRVSAESYTISYSKTNTDCFLFVYFNEITGIAASETMYTLTDLQEGAEYSITVTALVRDTVLANSQNSLTATTVATG